jgi:hypothetical protein
MQYMASAVRDFDDFVGLSLSVLPPLLYWVIGAEMGELDLRLAAALVKKKTGACGMKRTYEEPEEHWTEETNGLGRRLVEYADQHLVFSHQNQNQEGNLKPTKMQRWGTLCVSHMEPELVPIASWGTCLEFRQVSVSYEAPSDA